MSIADSERELHRNIDNQSLFARASATQPAQNAVIASIAIPAAGTYYVDVYAHYGATGDTHDGMHIAVDGVNTVVIPMQPGNNTVPVSFKCRLRFAAAATLAVRCQTAAAAVGSIYLVTMVATKISD